MLLSIEKRESADYLVYLPSLPPSLWTFLFLFPFLSLPCLIYPPLHSCCTLPHLSADRLVDINRAGLPCGDPKSHDSHAGIMWHPLPRMLQRLPTRVAFLGVKFHQATDEIFGLIRNAVPRGERERGRSVKLSNRFHLPVRRVKLVIPAHDLFEKLGIIFMIKRRIAT